MTDSCGCDDVTVGTEFEGTFAVSVLLGQHRGQGDTD